MRRSQGAAVLAVSLASLLVPASAAHAAGGGSPVSLGVSNVPFDSTDSCQPGWPCHVLGSGTNPTTTVGPQGCKDWPDFPLCKSQAGGTRPGETTGGDQPRAADH